MRHDFASHIASHIAQTLQTTRDGRTTLLSSLEVRPDGQSDMVGTITIMPEGHCTAIVEATAARYGAVTGRTPPTTAMLREVPDGSTVSVLRHGRSGVGAASIVAYTGKLIVDAGGERVLMPPRQRRSGYNAEALVSGGATLDLEVGKDALATLIERIKRVREQLPTLERFTPAHLAALPAPSDGATNGVFLALFGTEPFITGPIPGAIWLLHSALHEDDIVEGWLITPPNSDAVSEHSSFYGRERLHMDVGVVRGFVPPSPGEVLRLMQRPYEEVLASLAVFPRSTTGNAG